MTTLAVEIIKTSIKLETTSVSGLPPTEESLSEEKLESILYYGIAAVLLIALILALCVCYLCRHECQKCCCPSKNKKSKKKEAIIRLLPFTAQERDPEFCHFGPGDFTQKGTLKIKKQLKLPVDVKKNKDVPGKLRNVRVKFDRKMCFLYELGSEIEEVVDSDEEPVEQSPPTSWRANYFKKIKRGHYEDDELDSLERIETGESDYSTSYDQAVIEAALEVNGKSKGTAPTAPKSKSAPKPKSKAPAANKETTSKPKAALPPKSKPTAMPHEISASLFEQGVNTGVEVEDLGKGTGTAKSVYGGKVVEEEEEGEKKKPENASVENEEEAKTGEQYEEEEEEGGEGEEENERKRGAAAEGGGPGGGTTTAGASGPTSEESTTATKGTTGQTESAK